jgi:predicted transcriptional regulator
MDWKLIIERLNAKGVTDAKIAKHADISQAQVHRLRSGQSDDIYAKKGQKIFDLCDLIGVKTE